jgi:ribosomal protein S12 methylthiotransferase
LLTLIVLKTKSTNKKINLISLGCSKNLVDSEVLMGQLNSNNIEVTFEKDDSKADVVVINTCGFIHDAKQESIETILNFVEAKKNGLIEKVYVMGCLSERYKKDLQNEIEDVDSYFGVNDISKIVAELGGQYRKELVGERVLTTPSHFAYLKIAEGCDRRCSFCAIPFIRGKHISRPVDEIVVEAKRLIEKGVKEIILISQDLSYYGLDLYKKNMLPELVDRLSALEGMEWLRLHYLYPFSFPMEVLYLMKERANICNYVDMPVQHISDRILKSMRRGHEKADTYRLLERVKNTIPDAALRTTLITGYPGETEKDFQQLLDFIGEVKFDRLGVFAYSPEEDTAAFKLKDDVPDGIKQERVDAIMDLQQNISLELNNEKVGRTFKTLIDRKEGDYIIGRTEYDSPEVDNEVLISTNNSEINIGSFIDVKVSKADYFDLFGTYSQK